jgi:hypothetical protein
LVLLVCGVLAFFAFQKRGESVVQEGPAPTPSVTSATATPTVGPSQDEEAKGGEQKATPEEKREAPVAKKPEKTQRDEEKKARAAEIEAARSEAEGQIHVEIDPPVPNPPGTGNFPNEKRKPQTKVLPGGMTIRTFPDGSQIISMPDGTRFYVSADGKRTRMGPRRPPRRQPPPAPTP